MAESVSVLLVSIMRSINGYRSNIHSSYNKEIMEATANNWQQLEMLQKELSEL